MRASAWQDYAGGDEIVKEGEMDDRFYIIVSGNCAVERHGDAIGILSTGECFGETSYVQGAKRTATIRAADAVTVINPAAMPAGTELFFGYFNGDRTLTGNLIYTGSYTCSSGIPVHRAG